MAKRLILNRNEDTSQYFEKVFAALEFAKLLNKEKGVSRIEIKPDRKYGAERRIEDITKFADDGSIEIIQLKYSDSPASKWVYSDLWQTKATIQASGQQNSRYEGTSIFKFLKAWRFHKGQVKNVKLLLSSNKGLGADLVIFYGDIKKLREKGITWRVFSKKYDDELKNIKANFTNSRLKRGELEAFIKSLEFHPSKNISDLDTALAKELNGRGISDKDRIDAFITRTFRKFTQDDIGVGKADVEELLEIVKTSLVHAIDIPKNYIQRSVLEEKILQSVEKQKTKGGFVFLFASSGSGKTVLLSNLTQKNDDFLPYLCRIRPFEKVDSLYNYQKERLSSKWFKTDLIQRFFELGLTKETVSVKDDEDWINVVFERTLKQVSESALKRRNKRIIIIVDALDQVETDNYKGQSILDAIPPVKYPGVVFLLSTWGEKYLPRQISGNKISIDLGFIESEIKEYFLLAEIKLTPDQVRKVLKKTKGLAISLLYLAQKLKKVSRDEYDNVIDSQHEYKEVFDWYKPIWDSLNKHQKHALGCLSFHFTEIQKNKLYEITKIGLPNFSALNEKISPFVSLKGGYIEPYHDSFRRFIINKLKDFAKEYHKEIIKYYATPGHSSLPYARKYLTAHLAMVGINEPMVRNTTRKLINQEFIEKVLSSRLDYVSKTDSVRYFIKYFNATNDLEKFIKYVIQVSNLAPLTNDDDAFLKVSIGTPNLLREAEEDLSVIQNASIHTLREWILKRIRIGNFLKQNNDVLSESLAVRFIEDGLARISFNREILWSTDLNNHRYWENIQEYLEAHTNLGRYRQSADYISNIRFQKPTPSTVGFRANMMVALNRVQYPKDKKSVRAFLNGLSQGAQLVGYSYLYLEQKDSVAATKLRSLIKKTVLYKYLTNSKQENQNLDLSEVAYILKIKEAKSCITKLIKKQEFDPPYHHGGYSFWGLDGKALFLRKAALLSLTEKNFNEKNFYINSLKQHHKERFKEYENEAFASIVVMNILLTKNILQVRNGILGWTEFRNFLRSQLNIFKNEIKQVSEFRQLREYPFRDSTYIYYENTNSFIRDSLFAVATHFPKHFESFVTEVETLFANSVVEKNQAYSEIILEQLLPITPSLKRKIEEYGKRVLSNKTKEKLGNIEKSDGLKDLARTMNRKGYKEFAEDIYRHSLKYSHGLWTKEDFRILNLIDCLRTRTSRTEFDTILKYIDKIGNVLEGSWYYKLSFIESATYANFELALDYFSELPSKGETNLNEGLGRIIITALQRYPFKEIIPELLPLLDVLRFDEETNNREQANIQRIYHSLIEHSLKNKEILLARNLLNKYFIYLKRYVYVAERLRILEDLLIFIKGKKELRKDFKDIGIYINGIKKEGYATVSGSESKYQIIPDAQINQVKYFARKKSIKKIIELLNTFIKEDNRHKVGELVSRIIPVLNNSNINNIRKWCKENNVEFLTHSTLIALLEFSIQNADKKYFKQTKRDILNYCKDPGQPFYYPEEIIKRLDLLEFSGKRKFLKELIRCSIERAAGSSYYLNSFILRTSEMIDKYYPELKGFAYQPLKEVVENSMRLSLSKS